MTPAFPSLEGSLGITPPTHPQGIRGKSKAWERTFQVGTASKTQLPPPINECQDKKPGKIHSCFLMAAETGERK